jgi:hypothetical protein
MLICTGLGDNYSNLGTTIMHTKVTAQFTPDVIIPMILAESQQQGTSLTHQISADPACTIKKADNSKCCKICRGTSPVTENCWQKNRETHCWKPAGPIKETTRRRIAIELWQPELWCTKSTEEKGKREREESR